MPGGSAEPEPVPAQTWDGLPVAGDPPHGAAIVVRRGVPGAQDGQGPPAAPAADGPAADGPGGDGPGGDGPGGDGPGGDGPAGGGPGGEYLVLHRARRGPGYAGDWAWTSPSGARLPGEPVLAGARRELAEETGIEAARLRPCDLSGAWAVFITDVPAGTRVRLDAEHDSFAWLGAREAAGRLLPEHVAADFRRAAAIPPARITFRPLTAADLPALLGWMRAPHAARWFPGLPDLAGLERKYQPRIDGSSPVRVHIALIDGLAAGLLQHYPVSGSEGALAAGRDDTLAAGAAPDVGLDYVIGVPELTGRGLGAQLIWAYLQQVALPAHPAAVRVLACPEVANHQSIRALEKAGFRRSAVIPGEAPDRPELCCVLDRHRIFG